MKSEERPIVFTITYVTDSKLKVYTKDGRWNSKELCMTYDDISPSGLFDCINAITTVGKMNGYAIIFEVD